MADKNNTNIGFEDDRDAYVEDNIFFVPVEARWSTIVAAAHTPEIGTVINDAMRTVENENKVLKNVFPKNYASLELEKRGLGNVVVLFTNMDMGDAEESKDLLGRTYEYCIAQFAAYKGVKGGEFYTPSSIEKSYFRIGSEIKCGYLENYFFKLTFKKQRSQRTARLILFRFAPVMYLEVSIKN